MIGILCSFWDGLCLGAMLVLGRVKKNSIFDGPARGSMSFIPEVIAARRLRNGHGEGLSEAQAVGSKNEGTKETPTNTPEKGAIFFCGK